MKASVVDLRYKMNDILKALDRNEAVTVLYHGKAKGVIIPAKGQVLKKIKDHPFFGMSAKNAQRPVLEELDDLRKPRFNDI
jgi:hypothetical protein